MAITISQEPYPVTPVGQKLIVVATSDNISEPGFKYRVEVTVGLPTFNFSPLYLSPNPEGALVIDANPLTNMSNAVSIDSVPVHAILDIGQEPFSSTGNGGHQSFVFALLEAWIVDGVLTDDPDENGPIESELILWNATYQASDGYRPDPATRYLLDGTTKNWLTDRRWNTHKNDHVTTQGTNKVLIPVRETDWGVISMMLNLPDQTVEKADVTIFDSSGAPHNFEIDVTAGEGMIHLPVYPANINGSAFAEKPSDYPGWRYIQVRAENTDGTSVLSVNYILYNVDYLPYQTQTDCKHDVVRIGWKNYAGGWDYYNFTKRNENRITVDRKRYQKILGNYGDVDGSTDFNFTKQDSGLTELKPIVHKFLEVHSDWISEHEFVFLESLFTSQQVHWIHDDGTFTPVLCESEDYLMARERNGRLKNLQTKFKLANPVWV